MGLVFVLLDSCKESIPVESSPLLNVNVAFDYLKLLEGSWIVDGGEEGIFGWEFDVTSRGNVIIEKFG